MTSFTILTGNGQKPARESTSTISMTMAIWSLSRFDNWKAVFCEQRHPAAMQVWYEPLTA